MSLSRTTLLLLAAVVCGNLFILAYIEDNNPFVAVVGDGPTCSFEDLQDCQDTFNNVYIYFH